MTNFSGWRVTSLTIGLILLIGLAATAAAQTPVTSYPYTQGFENSPPYSEATLMAVPSGSYPTNSAGQGGVPSSSSGNQSGANGYQVVSSVNSASPRSGSRFLDMWGDGFTYLDIHFDLQGVSNQDPVTLEFYWSDSGSWDNNSWNGVFLSTNGGTSWELILYVLEPTPAANDTWNQVTVNVSNLMAARNLNYSSDTVIRWQMYDSLDSEHCLLDDITLTAPIPRLTADATAGAASMVYSDAQGAGSAGVESGKFTLTANSSGPITLNSLDLKASGSGDDSTAFSEVTIYRDDDSSGTYTSSDVMIASPSTFPADDGTLTVAFTGAEQDFAANDMRTYFVVTKLASTARPGETFKFAVEDLNVTGGNTGGVPTTVMEGLVIDTPEFTVTDIDTGPAQIAYLATADNVAQTFTIAYPAGPSDKPASVSITATGTADDAMDLVSAALWYDADMNDTFDATLDALIEASAYASDDGTIDFSFANHPTFMAGQTRRYFVVYELSSSGGQGESLQCYVSALGATTQGAVTVGLPAPSTSGAAGLEVGSNQLIVTYNGPSAAMMVASDSAGGDGELLYDVTLSTVGGLSWTLDGLTFNASGTGQADSAFSELHLYEDGGNGIWDGAAGETLEGTSTGFVSGAATFMPLRNLLLGNGTRRFFVVGILNGSASTGQTFNAHLESIATVPPAGGQVLGLPAQASTALVIDQPTLTLSNLSMQPAEQVHLAGQAASYTAAAFTMMTVNNQVDVSGVTLTMGGTGDWLSDVDTMIGVSIYLDNGNSEFDDNLDPLIYEGPGSLQVAATFNSPVTVPQGSFRSIWVVVTLTDTAGIGLATTPETFSVSIMDASDVAANSNVVLGTPAPSAELISAIEFRIDEFTPASGLPIGGDEITITGSGFVAPVTVRIGGQVCPGTPLIVDGTEITGLTVPEGVGANQPIVISTAYVTQVEIEQTYSYVVPSDGGGSSGCSMQSSGWQGAWMLLLLMLFGLPLRRMARR